MISTGHARAILAVEDPKEQYNLAQKIFDEKLSVRETEKLIKNLNKPAKEKKKDVNPALDVIYQNISENLKKKLSTKVTVSGKGNGSGKIEIEFYDNGDLERLLELLDR